MPYLTKSLLSSSLVAALLLVIVPGFATAEASTHGSRAISEQLSDIQRHAYDVRREADTLMSMTMNKNLSWQSHAYRLNQLKDQVNQMGRSLAELEQQKSSASQMQILAMDETRSQLQLVAAQLSRAIELVNEDRRSVHQQDYGQAVTQLSDHAEVMHTQLDTILEYDKASKRFDRLELPSPVFGQS